MNLVWSNSSTTAFGGTYDVRLKRESAGVLGIANNTPTTGILLGADGSAIFNEPSNDVDFRIESNGQTHMFFVDGTADRIGIGNSAPATLLQLGTAGSLAGSLSLAGGTSGLVTVDVAAAAGTWALTLPTSGGTSGYVLPTDGSGNTSWSNPASSGAWYQNDTLKVLHPTNVTYDVLIGGNTTASAKFSVNATAGSFSLEANGDKHTFSDITRVVNSVTFHNLHVASQGYAVEFEPDIQINGGDIVDLNAETRITLIPSSLPTAGILVSGVTDSTGYFNGRRGATLSATRTTDKVLTINGVTSQTADFFQINSTSAVTTGDIMMVSSAGLVGIGTTNPLAILGVRSTWDRTSPPVLEPPTDLLGTTGDILVRTGTRIYDGNTNGSTTQGLRITYTTRERGIGVILWLDRHPASIHRSRARPLCSA